MWIIATIQSWIKDLNNSKNVIYRCQSNCNGKMQDETSARCMLLHLSTLALLHVKIRSLAMSSFDALMSLVQTY